MKIRFLLTLTIFLCLSIPALALIDSVKLLTNQNSPKYTKVEVGIDVDPLLLAPNVNPYNSADVDMYAIFVSPDTTLYRRDAFFYIPFNRCDTCENDVVYKTSDPDYGDRCSKGWRDLPENLDPSI
ncbi:MAG: hypothetical protein EOO61_13165 [Hymenobacter sp.]|nr:MAG: hypothetical protein EOO61_13165 [Hymenobacter sp.]